MNPCPRLHLSVGSTHLILWRGFDKPYRLPYHQTVVLQSFLIALHQALSTDTCCSSAVSLSCFAKLEHLLPKCHSKEVITTQLIPGPPRELRTSSKRLSKYIKIRWKEPKQNPQAVFQYHVQMQLAKSKATPWYDVTTVGKEKLSAKATDLN